MVNKLPLLGLIALTSVTAFLVLYPAFWIVCGSVSSRFGSCGNFTLASYLYIYKSKIVLTSVVNTLVFASGSALLATSVSIVLAWITSRTNTPLRGLTRIFVIVPLLVAPMLTALAWVFLANPTTGLLNIPLQDINLPGFNIYSMEGMILVEGLSNVPLTYLVIESALQSVDPYLENSARVCGAGLTRVALGIDLSVIRPAILGASFLSFALAAGDFQIPSILSIPARVQVLTVTIQETSQVSYPPNNSLAAAIGVILLAITLTTVYAYWRLINKGGKFVMITGRGHPGVKIELGKIRYLLTSVLLMILLVVTILPVVTIFVFSLYPYFGANWWHVSLSNYLAILKDAKAASSMLNSLFLAIVGATLGILLSSFISYVSMRTKLRGRGVLEALSFIPFSFPGVVIGIGLLWGYVASPLYLTISLLMIAYITRFMTYGVRNVNAIFLQIDKNLENVSKMCGAGSRKTFTSIVVPLIRPGLISGWTILFASFLKELGTSIFLVGPNTNVMGVYFLQLYENAELTLASSLGVVMIAIGLSIIIIPYAASHIWRGSLRLGSRSESIAPSFAVEPE